MAKNICKRTFSSLLAILMVVTTFCFADLGLTASAWVDASPLESVGRPNSTASTSSANVMFLVPETIYLNPAGDAYAYYVDSTASGALVQNAAKTSGQIVFRSDVPVSNLKITRSDASGTTYTSSAKTTSFTTTFSNTGTARDGGVIEWKASYVVDGVTKGWAKSWRKKGWKKSDGKPALNPDLWGQLLDLLDVHDVEFSWIKGHAGHEENERCDRLAVSKRDQYLHK